MTYEEQYKQKLCPAEEAVLAVQSGCRMDFGYGVVTPVALDKALAARLPQLENVTMYGGMLTHRPQFFDIPEPKAHFTWNSWYTARVERALMDKLRENDMPAVLAINKADTLDDKKKLDRKSVV